MTLELPDDLLKLAGLTEKEALLEFACRLFQAGRLELWPAAKLAGLDRVSFEIELSNRGIPLYRPTLEDIRADLQTMRRIGA